VLKYYNIVETGDYYDDDANLTQSGTDFWASGVVLPISNSQGSSDAVLLEQEGLQMILNCMLMLLFPNIWNIKLD